MHKRSGFFKACDGATAIEYAFIAAMIAVAIVAVLLLIGGGLSERFGSIEAVFQ